VWYNTTIRLLKGENMTEILYRKVGRKYVPARQTFDDYAPMIPVGSFVLTYAYTEGGRSYTYDVKPDTAGFVAAAKIAQHAMEEAIREKCKYKPEHVKWTKKQQAIMEDFQKQMQAAGGNIPTWWTSASGYEIAQAGIDAVQNYKP
jgi:hypothetical protein